MRGVLPAELHDPLDTVILAPKMPQGRPAPFRIPITHDGQKGLVPLDQLRSVDRERLATKWGSCRQRRCSKHWSPGRKYFRSEMISKGV